jgi:hypothetical protein
MRGIRSLAVAGLLLLAARATFAQGLPPAPDAGPRAAAGPAAEASTGAAGKAAADAGWSAQEIASARARCAVLLKGLAVVAVPEGPVREGNDCGAPAPMRLISVGKEPQVAFSPPPTLTCDMIARLHKWLERDVQPLARKFLAAPVVRIETMSSYSCRNAYGRTHARLSEHGRANALDIGSFVTAHGQAALVISDWGPTAREVAAAAADSKAAPTPGARALRQAGPQATPSLRPLVSLAPPAEPPARAAAAATTGFSLSIPGIMVQLGGGSDKSADSAFAPAQRLGGPKPRTAAALPALNADARLDFLRAVHAAACRQFGTVLGPEANNWHKNHFHIDMAERPHGVICE